MRLAKEIIVTMLFLAIYAPLSIAIWYTTGRTANLVIVALIGLSIITAYLYMQIARYRWGHLFRHRSKHRASQTHLQISDAEEPTDSFEIIHFDNVFKPNFGKVEIDLD